MPLDMAAGVAEINEKMMAFQLNNPMFTTPQIQSAITKAVQAYDLLMPFITMDTFTMTANQSTYPFPSGAFNVRQDLFSTDTTFDPLYFGIQLTADVYFASYNLAVLINSESPANIARLETYKAKFSEYWTGRIVVDVPLQQFVIYPAPVSTRSGFVISERSHAYDSGTSKFLTVPDVDVPFILGHAQARLYRILAPAYAINDRTVGNMQIRGNEIAKTLLQEAERLEEEFRIRFYTPACGRS
jgi:hypothetical protein